IGRNDGGSGAAKVVYASTARTDQIITGANVTVNRSGQFDSNGISDQFNSLIIIDGSVVNTAGRGTITPSAGLTMHGGSINTGTGTLTLGSNVTYNASAAATIAGNLNLGGGNRTFTVNDGAALNDLTISALITGGAGSALTKAGTGTLLLGN